MKKRWRNKGREKAETKGFLFLMILFFLISAGASYIYFKPLLSSKASVKNYSSAAPSDINEKDTRDSSHRLYGSDAEEASAANEAGINNDSDLAGAENAIKKYLEPFNTELIDLYMDSSGIVYVDLGDEVKRKFKGDASEELNIISGLYRSIEEAVPGFIALKILISGKETETLGGHIDISMPVGGEITGGADNI